MNKNNYTINKIFVFVLILILARGQCIAQPVKQLSLQKALDYTLKNSPLMAKSKFELEKSKSPLKQVENMKILPITTLDVRAGIVPGASGDAFYSPDSKYDFKSWGPFYQADLTLVQPLWTFGRISNAENGANELIAIQELKNAGITGELSLSVIQSYWALVATARAVEIAAELKNAFDSLKVRIGDEINKEDSELDQSYLFEINSNEYIINMLYNNSISNRQLALATFRELVGLQLDSAVEYQDRKPPDFEVPDSAVNLMINIAHRNHNDIKMIESGLKAIDSKINFQNSSKLPMIYLAGGIQFGYAGNRNKQSNPYVYDSFNYLNLGCFLGAKWDFNLRSAEIEKQTWECEKLSMDENYKLLRSKISVEVTKAFLDAKSNYKQLNDIRQSMKSAKSWVEMEFDNWNMGIGEPERLIKGVNTYFQLRAKELESEFEYNTSIAKLANSFANINYYMEWVKNGKVHIK